MINLIRFRMKYNLKNGSLLYGSARCFSSDHYKTLHVGKKATEKEVKKAYYKLA